MTPNHIEREDGSKLAWWSAGSGTPVLLVMGLGARGHAWRRQVEGLQANHRLAWFDHRGIGESDPVLGPVTMATLAADALAVANAAGMERFHLVGVSMGGMVAQHVALQQRERVRTLTLIATHPGGLRHWLPPWQGMRELPRTRSRDSQVRAEALARLLYPPQHLALANLQEIHAGLLEDFGQHVANRTLQAQFSAVRGHDTRARLGELAGLPTLVVRPGHDNLVRQIGSEVLASQIPGAKLVRFDDAGHGVIRQCADRLNALLLDLFDAAPPA